MLKFWLRLLPVIAVVAACALWLAHVRAGGPYLLRNLLPLVAVVLLAAMTLAKGGGRYTGSGWRWPLGTLGFALPALGLSLYLHYAYATNLNDMFTGAVEPERVFAWLPAYTLGAGAVGFMIGWIVGRGAGRNV